MTTHSVWDSVVPPPYTLTTFNDAGDTIRLGNMFYTFTGAAAGWRVRGGRVYFPDNALTNGKTVRIFSYKTGPSVVPDLGATPLGEGTTTIGANGGWAEVTWTPWSIQPADAEFIFIGYELMNAVGVYVVTQIANSPPSTFVRAADNSTLVLMESNYQGLARPYFKVGNGATAPSSNGSAWYGVDVIVDEGASEELDETFGATVALENAKAGSVSGEWDILGAGDPNNQGFSRQFSVNAGETIDFSCDGAGTVLDIYRIGYYGGLGWRKVKSLTNTATNQPMPNTIPNTNGGIECSNWSITASWAVPADALSGLFVGVYRNVALNNASYIPFIIRNDSRAADVTYKTSDTTWALAYNYYAAPGAALTGKSLYGSGGPLGNIANRCHAVSYHRPIVTREGVPQTYWRACEAPLIRFLERNGINTKYISCKDLDAGISNIDGILISSGHDEYWSTGMRDNAELYRDNGGHLIFMSANEVFWRTRFDAGRNIMYCYKDTMAGPGEHVAGTPLDPVTWTGTWKDTRWLGRKPENTLTGTDFRMNGVRDEAAIFDTAAAYADHPFWRNTLVESGTGTITASGCVGFEADNILPTQPAASVKTLATTTININGSYANDDGEAYNGNGNLNWGVVSQRYASGAVVVGFGTCQWSWGLDNGHDRGAAVVTNTSMQQATLNLLSDLGAQPSTLMSGMTNPTPVSLNNYGAIPGTSKVKVWNGTAWVAQVKAWNGTAWVPVKTWNGSAWV